MNDKLTYFILFKVRFLLRFRSRDTPRRQQRRRSKGEIGDVNCGINYAQLFIYLKWLFNDKTEEEETLVFIDDIYLSRSAVVCVSVYEMTPVSERHR
jgi:hypothetical protein